MKPVILLADNQPEILDKWGRLLVAEDYEVIRAGSVAEAEEILRTRRVHLAILDVRLTEDNEPNDTSGIELARQAAFRSIPKIILTAHRDPEYVRRALQFEGPEPPAAAQFVFKEDGAASLLRAVRQILDYQLQINWNLRIRRNERQPVSFQQLVSLVASHEDGAGERAEEMADLFRKLFYEAEQINLDRLLWHGGNRAALTAFVYTRQGQERQVIVTCGLTAAVRDEQARYRLHMPARTGDTPEPDARAETLHFAAQTYRLKQNAPESVKTFAEFYRERPPRRINAVVERLVEDALAPWHAQQHIAPPGADTGQLYRVRLGLPASLEAGLRARMRHIGAEAQALGLGGIHLSDGRLSIQLLRTATKDYPDPVPFLASGGPTWRETSLQCAPTFGSLDGQTILVTGAEEAWPTDFGCLDIGPILGDYAAIEVAVLFDLLQCTDLVELHDFTSLLIGPARLNDRLDSAALPDELEKGLAVIRQIRQFAATHCGLDARPYYLGLLFYTARRLLAADADGRLPKSLLAPLAHACMLLGMLGARLEDGPASGGQADVTGGIDLDEGRHQARVEGKTVDLTATEYRALAYLYQHAEELVERDELFEAAYDQKYAAEAAQQLNMLVTRLRQKIEPDPEQFTYLVTRRGQGYTLHRRPIRPA